jgi:hypothetical protein
MFGAVPLRSKDEAVIALRHWHRAIKNKSDEKPKSSSPVMGNVLNDVADWCNIHVFEKARAMQLACNAPPDFWDEFCAAAAYSTSLTSSVSLKGKPPYEMWHGDSTI